MGVVAGDMIGSVYERFPTKEMDFPLFSVYSRFTDDTVMTMANADWLLHGGNLASIMQEYGRRFPRAGYGGRDLPRDRAGSDYRFLGKHGL